MTWQEQGINSTNPTNCRWIDCFQGKTYSLFPQVILQVCFWDLKVGSGGPLSTTIKKYCAQSTLHTWIFPGHLKEITPLKFDWNCWKKIQMHIFLFSAFKDSIETCFQTKYLYFWAFCCRNLLSESHFAGLRDFLSPSGFFSENISTFRQIWNFTSQKYHISYWFNSKPLEVQVWISAF